MPKKLTLKCYFGCPVDSIGPLHTFPTPRSLKWELHQYERFNKWKAVLDQSTVEKGDNYIRNSVRICYRHFENCYRLPSGLLTKNAIPTLNIAQASEPMEILTTPGNTLPDTTNNLTEAIPLVQQVEPSTSAEVPGGILHRFPNPNTDQERFQAWIKRVRGEVATLDHNNVFKNRRICHKHFEQIYYVPKNRLFKTAIPTLHLGEISDVEDASEFQPPISDTEPTDVEACRICLATDVKMYSLTHLGHSMDTIAGCSKSFNGLLNVVCYQCAPILVKYNKLIEKSRKAQTILEHILETNGQITKPLLEEQNKSQLDLKSPLDSYLLKDYYYIKYDDDSNLCSDEDTSVSPDKEVQNAESKFKMKINSDSDSDVESVEIDGIVVQNSSDDDEFGSLESHEVNTGKKPKDLIYAKFAYLEKRCLKGITKKGKKKILQRKQKIRTVSDPPDDSFINKILDAQKIPDLACYVSSMFKRTYFKMTEPLTVGRIFWTVRTSEAKISSEASLNTFNPVYVDTVPKTLNMKFTCSLCQKVFRSKQDAKDHHMLGCERKIKNTTRIVSPPTGQLLFWEDLGGSNG